jgi:hypothetical protein
VRLRTIGSDDEEQLDERKHKNSSKQSKAKGKLKAKSMVEGKTQRIDPITNQNS